MDCKVLTLEESLEHGRKVWMETMETDGTVPVCFYSERKPFLMFDAQDRVLMISVRAENYGETWRCWNAKPPAHMEKENAAILDSVDAGKKKLGRKAGK